MPLFRAICSSLLLILSLKFSPGSLITKIVEVLVVASYAVCSNIS